MEEKCYFILVYLTNGKSWKVPFEKKSIYDVIEKYILYQATKSIFQRGQYID